MFNMCKHLCEVEEEKKTILNGNNTHTAHRCDDMLCGSSKFRFNAFFNKQNVTLFYL